MQFSVHGVNREVMTARSAYVVLRFKLWHAAWLAIKRCQNRELRKDMAYSAQPSSAERVLLLLPPSHLACGLPAASPSEPPHAHLHFRSSLQVAEPSPPQTAGLSCIRCKLPASALNVPCILLFGALRNKSHQDKLKICKGTGTAKSSEVPLQSAFVSGEF